MIDNPVVRYGVYDTAIGDVTLVAKGRKIMRLFFGAVDPSNAKNEENSALYDAIIELNQYGYGQRKSFDLSFSYDENDIDRLVYEYCRSIPYGKTSTLLAMKKETKLKEETILASLIKNPLPIFIPTHRIVSEEGEMIAFPPSLRGIAEKLLAIERGEGRRIYVEDETSSLDLL